ncbi:DUF167 domain-containing protein [Hydrogenobacter hydrogenophilus]|uniref:Uncharacterized protein n=1 Tax=Hydrogenobacter hydrogenophilus TaxID=35835 RepID=A0A285NYA8_9AQUI|nr:DUF167 domain-containing protein [Hydrogenobacter hydrogenophilus]SNZ14465.1 hypothetical protein SAMN06265353_1109 [Hydrogenobacter hydrogenophilus]
MILEVRAKAKAKKEYVKTITQNVYEVAVKEPPHRGKANERIVELLSAHLGVSKNRIKLIKGASSKIKLFQIDL